VKQKSLYESVKFDELVSIRRSVMPDLIRHPESFENWIPAFAGMTGRVDPGFRRDDGKTEFANFYKAIIIEANNNIFCDLSAVSDELSPHIHAALTRTVSSTPRTGGEARGTS